MGTPIRIDGLLVKAETEYGTDPTPTVGDNGVHLSQRAWSNIRISHVWPNNRDDFASGKLTPLGPAPKKGRIAEFDVFWPARGAGSAYSSSTPVRPEADPLIVACGLSRTHDDTSSSEKVTYAPADSSHLSCTAWVYAGGWVFKVVGCRGTMVWPIQAGQLGTLRFTMRGMVATDPAVASVPAITYGAQLPPAAVGMTMTVGSWSPNIVSSEFQVGANVQQLDDANGDDGLEGFGISDFNSRYLLTARSETSDYDPYAGSRDPTTGLSIDQTLGSTQYNRLKLDVNAAAHLLDPEHAEDNQFAAWNLEYLLRGSTPFSFIFD